MRPVLRRREELSDHATSEGNPAVFLPGLKGGIRFGASKARRVGRDGVPGRTARRETLPAPLLTRWLARSMSHNAPLRSLPLLSLLLAGPLVGSHALGQSNVRPAPVIGKAPRAASVSNIDSRAVEEALWLRLSTAPVLEEPEWVVDMDLHTTALPNTDLSLPGERSVVRGGWDAALTRELGDRSFTVFLNSEASFYDWNAPAPIVGTTTDPFNDLYSTHPRRGDGVRGRPAGWLLHRF